MTNNKSTFKALLPLFAMFALCTIYVIIRQIYVKANVMEMMLDFMASFFILFGSLKVINLKGFVNAYKKYDLISGISETYAYLYPFIEISLGIAYWARMQLFIANLVTLILMSIGTISVLYAMLFKKEKLMCACLGDLFAVPLTYVTLFEDLLMAVMAAIMLLFF